MIHSEIIDATGGVHGVRDVGLLMSLIEKPGGRFGGKDLYAGIFMKAAAYLESLVHYHVFIDGNKRTGIAVAARFFSLNGFELIATNREIEDFVLRVATHKPPIKEIAVWLKAHAKKLQKSVR